MNAGILLLAKLIARQAVKAHFRDGSQENRGLAVRRSNRVVPPQIKKD